MSTQSLAKILIVDDQEYNIHLLERILQRAGFKHIHSRMDATHILQYLVEIKPDIILLDLHMPGIDGIQAIQLIRQHIGADDYLPVLMLTADHTKEAKQNGLKAGVNDFLNKPYDRMEVVLRINNLLKTRELHKQISEHNQKLEERVQHRTEQLQKAKMEILRLFGRAAEYRDDMTGMHTQRVGILSERIAQRLELPAKQVALIGKAAPLHDVGKIGIPDHILLKTGRFDPHEFDQMKLHTIIGAKILEGSSFDVLRTAEIISHYHHEKWDGTGYPEGLKGEEIPLEARIVALADFYDALIHERPYKKAWTSSEAIEEIIKQNGQHFDPKVVEAFLNEMNQGLNVDHNLF